MMWSELETTFSIIVGLGFIVIEENTFCAFFYDIIESNELLGLFDDD